MEIKQNTTIDLRLIPIEQITKLSEEINHLIHNRFEFKYLKYNGKFYQSNTLGKHNLVDLKEFKEIHKIK